MEAVNADECRATVELLCGRILRRDFDAGELPQDVQPETLKQRYCGTGDAALAFVEALINDVEWSMSCERVAGWQDLDRERGKPVLQRIFARFSRYPTIDRVSDILGADRASEYRAALETIENDAALSLAFPSERVAYSWRKFDMDAAVTVTTDVLAPNAGDESAMANAYQRLVMELRARRKERASVLMHADDREKRKALVRSLGIWFPLPKDLDQWRTDPRTAPSMPEFEAIVSRVSDRMKLVRSYLQHVPRRRLSTRTCKDLAANLDRMRAYLRGEATVSPAP